jgi:predicted MFS family arabinose efflux permease
VVGNVMSGLLLGIMLARPVSSLITSVWGWHAVFGFSAVVTAAVAVVLARVLPQRQPAHRLHYADLVGSMWGLLKSYEILRRRGIYHAFMFAGFSLFWTAVPLLLASPAFGLGQRGIALFALVGVSGAVAAPIAGRLADRDLMRPVTIAALALAALGFLLCRVGLHGSTWSLLGLTAAAVILDFAVSANLVVSQRAIYSLKPEYRSRLNGLFMAMFFVGGAVGSAVGGWAYASGGWSLTCWIGLAFPLLSFLYFATEPRALRAHA